MAFQDPNSTNGPTPGAVPGPAQDPSAGGITATPDVNYLQNQENGGIQPGQFGQSAGGANAYSNLLSQAAQGFAGQKAPNPFQGPFSGALASDGTQLAGDEAAQQKSLQSLYEASQGRGPNPAADAIRGGLSQQQAGQTALARSGGFGNGAALASRQALDANATNATTAGNTIAATDASQRATALGEYSRAADQFAQQRREATTAQQGLGVGYGVLQGTQNAQDSQNMLAAQQQAQDIQYGQLGADTSMGNAFAAGGAQQAAAQAAAASQLQGQVVGGTISAAGGLLMSSDILGKSNIAPAGGQPGMMGAMYGGPRQTMPMQAPGMGGGMQPLGKKLSPYGMPGMPPQQGLMGGGQPPQMMGRTGLGPRGMPMMAAPHPMQPGAFGGGGGPPSMPSAPQQPAAMGAMQQRPVMTSQMISDLRTKEDVHGASERPGGRTEADKFLETMSPYSYRYKDPSNEPSSQPSGGRYLGVMAQNVEKGPTGDTIVKETPRGKALEGVALMSAMAAGEGRLHERVSDVEAKLAAMRKGRAA